MIESMYEVWVNYIHIWHKLKEDFDKVYHTTYSWNIKWQKWAGIYGLWVLNETIQKKTSWKYEKNRGSRLEVTC